MRYFVLDTEAEAQALVDLLDERGRIFFAQAGYTIREDGAIIGKRDGADDPGGVTTTWDVPRQRADGKWVVTHIEAHAMASYELPGGGTVLDFVMAGITAPAEEDTPGWWPAPEDSEAA